jgi:23S rRNA pseudouridine1911/1915/1917 synthase
MPIVETECAVTPETAGRADQVVQQLTGRSRADVRGLFAHGGVRLNGQAISEPGLMVHPGDAVAVRHDTHRRYREPPPSRRYPAFTLVYEDAFLIVVDKAAALLTVPSKHRERNTVVEAVTRHIARRRRNARAFVVHRLDRGTSGLLAFAKDAETRAALRQQFRSHTAEREYVTIVAGNVAQDEGTFVSRLATVKKTLHRRTVAPDEPGEDAVTHFRVERRLAGATLVRVRLETGRRNQIRVHFSEAGHPVLGDERYCPGEATHPVWTAKRLALHAAVLGFRHPGTGKSLRFESRLPVEFERFLSRG